MQSKLNNFATCLLERPAVAASFVANLITV